MRRRTVEFRQHARFDLRHLGHRLARQAAERRAEGQLVIERAGAIRACFHVSHQYSALTRRRRTTRQFQQARPILAAPSQHF